MNQLKLEVQNTIKIIHFVDVTNSDNSSAINNFLS